MRRSPPRAIGVPEFCPIVKEAAVFQRFLTRTWCGSSTPSYFPALVVFDNFGCAGPEPTPFLGTPGVQPLAAERLPVSASRSWQVLEALLSTVGASQTLHPVNPCPRVMSCGLASRRKAPDAWLGERVAPLPSVKAIANCGLQREAVARAVRCRRGGERAVKWRRLAHLVMISLQFLSRVARISIKRMRYPSGEYGYPDTCFSWTERKRPVLIIVCSIALV